MDEVAGEGHQGGCRLAAPRCQRVGDGALGEMEVVLEVGGFDLDRAVEIIIIQMHINI